MKICPECRSNQITLYMGGQFGKYECKKCGYIGALILEREDKKKIKVLIIGAGFAGLRTAFILQKIMKNNVSITVIDKNEVNLFVPGIIGYVTNKLGKKNITMNLSELLKKRRINFLQDKVKSINPERKEVYVGKKVISYDYLVVSLGAETNTYRIEGVDKYAFKFKTMKDADRLKREINILFKSKKEPNITVIGGGITGVQLASHLKDYFDKMSFTNNIAISLVHSNHRVLKELLKSVSKKVEDYFLKKKISIFLNSKVAKIEKNKIHLQTKQMLHSDLIIWTGGITAPKELEKFNLNFSDKGIYVNKYFQTITEPFVFALGDCMSFKDKKLQKHSIKRAQIAHEQGKLVARNIANHILQKKMIPYTPKEIPTIISLSPNSILHYKKFIVQNRFITFLDNLIRLRHKLLYSY